MNQPPTDNNENQEQLPPPGDLAKQELAKRILSRRRLIHFTKATLPEYEAGWVHDDMAARLERFSREVTEKKSPRLMLLVPPRHGKAICDETPVFTQTRGWITHGELKRGDMVFHPSGRPVIVMEVADPVTGDCEVEFSDGEKIRCHENHEWTVYDRRKAKWVTYETHELPALLAKSHRGELLLPPTFPLHGRYQKVPVDPYTLGVWLGDGMSASGTICGAPEDLDKILAHLPSYQTLGAVRINPNTGCKYATLLNLRTHLRGLGILDCKHIPDVYFSLPEPHRRRLLAGIVDTDGSLCTRDGRVRVCTNSLGLAFDIRRLARGLGYRVTIQYRPADRRERTMRSSGARIQGGGYWAVGWVPYDRSGGGLALERKVPTRSGRPKYRTIRKMRRVEPFSARCIEVMSTDGLYLVGEALIPTHNSELASIRLPAWHLGHNPTHGIINAGYNLDLPMIFSRKVRGLLRDPYYHSIFPDTQLDPESQATETWATTSGGGFVAAGVGGGLTGKGCFSVDSAVDTPHNSPVPISGLRPGDIVYGYDHTARRVVETRVLAVSVAGHPVGTGRYADVRCTADHELYCPATGRYERADEIARTGLPVLHLTDAPGFDAVQGVLRPAVRSGEKALPALWREESAQRCHVPRMSLTGFGRLMLNTGMRLLRGGVQAPRRGADQTGAAGGGEPRFLLCRTLSRLATGARRRAARGVCMVLRTLGAERPEEVLLSGVLRRAAAGPVGPDPICSAVGHDEARGLNAGPAHLRADAGAQVAGGPPHRPQSGEQRSGEPYCVVEEGARVLSLDVSRTARSLAGLVSRPGVELVYDIQTETGNFFVEGVLAHNCHILIIDDPIKNMEEADSADRRLLIDEWYQSTASTRVAPGGGILLIETWWSWDDLAGRLQQRMRLDPMADQFEVVLYPALSTTYEYRDESSPRHEIIRTAEPIKDVPERYTLLRGIDTALHEERYSTHALKKIRANLQPRIWSALYQQAPTPDEGLYFRKEHFRFEHLPPLGEHVNYYTAWDFAIGLKQQNDYTVGATVAHDDYDHAYVPDIVRFKGDSFEIVDSIVTVAERYMRISGGRYVVGVEDGQIWRSIEPLLRKRMDERKVFPTIEVMKPLTDKVARARPLQGRMQQGKVSFPMDPPWKTELLQEMLQFPGGGHDDIVDALAWAIRLITNAAPPRLPDPPKVPSWRDKILNTVSGGNLTHMTS